MTLTPEQRETIKRLAGYQAGHCAWSRDQIEVDSREKFVRVEVAQVVAADMVEHVLSGDVLPKLGLRQHKKRPWWYHAMLGTYFLVLGVIIGRDPLTHAWSWVNGLVGIGLMIACLWVSMGYFLESRDVWKGRV